MHAIHRGAALWNKCSCTAAMMSRILVMSHTDSLGSAHKVSGQYVISSLSFIELQLFLPEYNPFFALLWLKLPREWVASLFFRPCGFRPGYGVEITPVVLVLTLHSDKGLVLLELPSAFHMPEQETILLPCLKFLLRVCKFIPLLSEHWSWAKWTGAGRLSRGKCREELLLLWSLLAFICVPANVDFTTFLLSLKFSFQFTAIKTPPELLGCWENWGSQQLLFILNLDFVLLQEEPSLWFCTVSLQRTVGIAVMDPCWVREAVLGCF